MRMASLVLSAGMAGTPLVVPGVEGVDGGVAGSVETGVDGVDGGVEGGVAAGVDAGVDGLADLEPPNRLSSQSSRDDLLLPD